MKKFNPLAREYYRPKLLPKWKQIYDAPDLDDGFYAGKDDPDMLFLIYRGIIFDMAWVNKPGWGINMSVHRMLWIKIKP